MGYSASIPFISISRALIFPPTPCFKWDCNNQLGFLLDLFICRLSPEVGHPPQHSSRVSGSDLWGRFGKPAECFTISGNGTSGWMGVLLLALWQISLKARTL